MLRVARARPGLRHKNQRIRSEYAQKLPIALSIGLFKQPTGKRDELVAAGDLFWSWSSMPGDDNQLLTPAATPFLSLHRREKLPINSRSQFARVSAFAVRLAIPHDARHLTRWLATARQPPFPEEFF